MYPNMAAWYRASQHLPRTLSDHSPVVLALWIPRPEGCERQGRFPSQALLVEVFRTELHGGIVEYFDLNTGSVQSWAALWEAFKAYIRGVCISKHAGLLRDLRRTLTSIEQKLSSLDQEQLRLPAPTQHGRRLTLNGI